MRDVAVVVLVVAAICVMVFTIRGGSDWQASCEGLGRQCRIAGVPSSDNPYRGSDSMRAEAWLKGWIEAGAQE